MFSDCLKVSLVCFLQEALPQSEDDYGRAVREHATGGHGEDAGGAAGENLRGRPLAEQSPIHGGRHRIRRETGKGSLKLSESHIAKALLTLRQNYMMGIATKLNYFLSVFQTPYSSASLCANCGKDTLTGYVTVVHVCLHLYRTCTVKRLFTLGSRVRC